jgi:hypothetical protein
MFMWSFIFVMVCGLLFGSESVQVFFICFYMYMLLEIQLSIGEGWNPIKGFSPAICFVPVTSQDLDFQHHMSWFFLCSVSSVKMRVGL